MKLFKNQISRLRLRQGGFNDAVTVAIIGGIVGAIFIGGVFVWGEIGLAELKESFIYNIANKSDLKINNKTNTVCENFDAEACNQANGCKGIYSSSSCRGGICTADIVFKGCVGISGEILERVAADKKLCIDTDGEWRSDEFSKPGECNCPNSYYEEEDKELYYSRGRLNFVSQLGCITERSLCEEKNGVWKVGRKYLEKTMNERECNQIDGSVFVDHPTEGMDTCKIYDEKGYARDNPKCLTQ